ncbi:MAG: hypothetical protein HC862_09980 [Scytonema sp. RU_4_4]|nr:hypothetical protein [Scytonema sp. RU_4_4]
MKIKQEDDRHSNLRIKIHFNWLVCFAVVAQGLLHILATCTESYASVPDTATMTKLSTTENNKPLVRRHSGAMPEPAKVKDILHSWLKESLIIPAGGSWVHLMFKYGNGQVSPLVQVGPNKKTTSEYLFPCKSVNNTTIGWSLINARSGGCLTMQVSGGIGRVSQFPSSISKHNHQTTKRISSIVHTTKNLQNAQNSVSQVQYYCGAVADSQQRQWKISVGLPSLESACQEAIQKCSVVVPNGKCLVASLGDWNTSDPNVAVSMVCTSSQRPVSLLKTKIGSGSTVVTMLKELEQNAIFLNSIACVPSVYGPNDVVISPTTPEPTLVQTRNVNGNLEIDVLAGSVNIVSAQRIDGLFLEKGHGYRHQQNKLVRVNCPKILQSESVQEFLEFNNWSQDVAPQLDGYRKAFCQTGEQQSGHSRLDLGGIMRYIINVFTPTDNGPRRINNRYITPTQSYP